jgi:hypothetical protein
VPSEPFEISQREGTAPPDLMVVAAKRANEIDYSRLTGRAARQLARGSRAAARHRGTDCQPNQLPDRVERHRKAVNPGSAEDFPGPEASTAQQVLEFAHSHGMTIYHAVGSAATGPSDDDVVAPDPPGPRCRRSTRRRHLRPDAPGGWQRRRPSDGHRLARGVNAPAWGQTWFACSYGAPRPRRRRPGSLWSPTVRLGSAVCSMPRMRSW